MEDVVNTIIFKNLWFSRIKFAFSIDEFHDSSRFSRYAVALGTAGTTSCKIEYFLEKTCSLILTVWMYTCDIHALRIRPACDRRRLDHSQSTGLIITHQPVWCYCTLTSPADGLPYLRLPELSHVGWGHLPIFSNLPSPYSRQHHRLSGHLSLLSVTSSCHTAGCTMPPTHTRAHTVCSSSSSSAAVNK